MPTDYGQPLPGEGVANGTVIASVIACEPDVGDCERYQYAVILLNKQPPYYTVATIEDTSETTWTILHREDHPNIVPAVRAYEQNGGDY